MAGPSRTAQRVAAHRLEVERREVDYGRAADDLALACDVAGGLEVGHEDMHRYLAARTAFFDGCVVDAIDSGVTQVVVLGAGYDGRSLRYGRDGVTYFEVDLAATQRDKLDRLARLGIDVAAVRHVECDFARDDLSGLLCAAGLDVSRRSLFLLEGVVSYLADDTVERLLAAAASVAVRGSALAVSTGIARNGSDPTSAERVAAFRSTVAALGEPVRSTLTAIDVLGVLAGCGWAPVEPRTQVGDVLDAATRQRLGLVVARRS